MTCQEIHEAIWKSVCNHIRADPYERNILSEKDSFIGHLCAEGMISRIARDILYYNNGCVLCALYASETLDPGGYKRIYCSNCPLDSPNCNQEGSLFDKVMQAVPSEALEAAKQIRKIDVLSGCYNSAVKKLLEGKDGEYGA